MSRLLLLLVCLSARCYAGNSTSTLSRIPDILQGLCLGANVCPENQTSPAQEYTFSLPEFGSCCTECSCSSDCNENGNCCFPHKILPQDYEGLHASQKEHSCIYPVIPLPLEQDVILYQSYSMMSSVPENVDDGSKSLTSISCGEENVAPWGSLYPVYSAKSKQIYKNMACAAADGVTDGIVWDAVLTCNNFFDGIILDASNFVLGLDFNSISNECAVNFVYRGNIEDVQYLKCYADVIKTCSDSHFKIPDEVDASEVEIIEMCTSGLVAPYRTVNMYANVFCHICNNRYFRRDTACRQLYDETGRGPQNRGFVSLLDEHFIIEGRKKIIRDREEFPAACSIGEDSGSCRPLLCPSGQLRGGAGVCTYPNKLWYDQDYTVYLNLTTETVINVTDVFKQGMQYKNYLPDFKSPWPKDWFIESIFTDNDILEGDYKRSSLQVKLRRKFSAVQPKYIVQTVKKMAVREWTLQHKNASFVLKSHISRYSNIDAVKLNRDASFFFGTNTTTKNKILYKRRHFYGNVLFITKLYFCDQVELDQHEGILGPYKKILFNRITKRHLYEGEFALVWNSAYDGMRARICFEESEMYEMVSHSGAEWCTGNYCVWLIAVTLILSGGVKE